MAAFVDTPRTDFGNQTRIFGGPDGDIANMSLEKSFLSPPKRPRNAILQAGTDRARQGTATTHRGAARPTRGSRYNSGQPPRTTGPSLRTPVHRAPLTNRPNFPAPAAGAATARKSGEFTPLLRSATKRNADQRTQQPLIRDRSSGQPRDGAMGPPATPAFLRASFRAHDTPAGHLPETSVLLNGSEAGGEQSFAAADVADRLPRVVSSSAASTPVVRTNDQVLDDQRNLMTLREQESIIDKVEKENFGLKLKIHFLEDLLRKSDPNLNQTAIKENTDLRVDKVTLQKDLVRMRKQLLMSQRETETLRQEAVANERLGEHNASLANLERELEEVRRQMDAKEEEADDLRREIQQMQNDDEDVPDLKRQLDEARVLIEGRDRTIDEMDSSIDDLQDQVEQLKQQLEAKTNEAAATQDNSDLQERLEELQEQLEQLKASANEALEDQREASRERDRAVEQLDELREEMADRALTAKDHDQGLEETVERVENQLQRARQERDDLETELGHAHAKMQRLEIDMEAARRAAELADHETQEQTEKLRSYQRASQYTLGKTEVEMQRTVEDLKAQLRQHESAKARHDAMITESEALQRNLAAAQATISKHERDLSNTRRQASENDQDLRTNHQRELRKLSDEKALLQRDLDLRTSSAKNQQDAWSVERRDSQAERDRLQREIDDLQLSLARLRRSAESGNSQDSKASTLVAEEKERYEKRIAALTLEAHDRKADADKQQRASETERAELQRTREDLRWQQREVQSSQEKIQALEDEVEVLQVSMEEDLERARQEASQARAELQNARRQLASVQQQAANNNHLGGFDETLRLQDEIQDLRGEKERLDEAIAITHEVNNRLQQRIDDLEKDHRAQRKLSNHAADNAAERSDLHELLKTAKLEAEDLHVQLLQRERRLETATAREAELEKQLQRARQERSGTQRKAAAITDELEHLQRKYELKVDELVEQQRLLDDERRALHSRVRFTHASVSSRPEDDGAHFMDNERRKTLGQSHRAELRGLAKQIQWLRARCRREEAFREGLAFEKRFLLMQVEMFQACNLADLQLLEEMGIKPRPSQGRKPRRLRTVVHMVMAAQRLQQLQRTWADKKKMQAAVVRKAEQVKERRKHRAIVN